MNHHVRIYVSNSLLTNTSRLPQRYVPGVIFAVSNHPIKYFRNVQIVSVYAVDSVDCILCRNSTSYETTYKTPDSRMIFDDYMYFYGACCLIHVRWIDLQAFFLQCQIPIPPTRYEALRLVWSYSTDNGRQVICTIAQSTPLNCWDDATGTVIIRYSSLSRSLLESPQPMYGSEWYRYPSCRCDDVHNQQLKQLALTINNNYNNTLIDFLRYTRVYIYIYIYT